MTPREFSTVTNNITVSVPMFRVRPDGEKTGDAKKAFPGDKFITFYSGSDGDRDYAVDFQRLNSHNKVETNEDQEPLKPWRFKLSQVQYCGDVSVPYNTWQEREY